MFAYKPTALGLIGPRAGLPTRGEAIVKPPTSVSKTCPVEELTKELRLVAVTVTFDVAEATAGARMIVLKALPGT